MAPKGIYEENEREPMRRYSNPLIAKEIHIPDQGTHIGLGLDWVKQVMIKVLMCRRCCRHRHCCFQGDEKIHTVILSKSK